MHRKLPSNMVYIQWYAQPSYQHSRTHIDTLTSIHQDKHKIEFRNHKFHFMRKLFYIFGEIFFPLNFTSFDLYATCVFGATWTVYEWYMHIEGIILIQTKVGRSGVWSERRSSLMKN